MTEWRQPLRTLPTTVRRVGGETTVSYVVRLAEANHLRPATLFHCLGKWCSPAAAADGILTRRVILNTLATRRLIAVTGIDRDRLLRALPDLGTAGRPSVVLPADIPAMRWRQSLRDTPACRYCLARRGIRSAVRVRQPARWDLLCYRHRIWPDGLQTTLDALPGVFTAWQRYRCLRRRHGTDHPEVRAAEDIVTDWYNFGRPRYPALRTRWHDRFRRIAVDPAAASPETTAVVILPEIAVLARCLIAGRSVTNPPDSNFLKRVTTTVGLRGPWDLHPDDPLRLWVRAARQRPTRFHPSY